MKSESRGRNFMKFHEISRAEISQPDFRVAIRTAHGRTVNYFVKYVPASAPRVVFRLGTLASPVVQSPASHDGIPIALPDTPT